MLIDVAGVAVVIPHECLGAAQDVALRVVEGGGDDALELEGELIGGFAAVVVQLVANAVDEVVCGFEFAECGDGEQLAFDEVLETTAAALHAGDPLDALVIAQAAAAFLHIRFLQEDRVRVFFMSAAHVLAAQFEESRLAFVDAFLGEAGLKISEQLSVAADKARIHERGFIFLIQPCLLDAFGNRAAGMADLEAHVPEEIEDVLHEVL